MLRTISLPSAGLPLAAALFIFTTFAYAANVRTDYDHGANFDSYHTYSWGQVKMENPLYVDRIKAVINKDLQAKGWQMVPSGGSTTVFVTGTIKNEQELETMYNGMGGMGGMGMGRGGWGGGWGYGGFGGFGNGFNQGGFGESNTTVTQQPVGHLVLDIFDSSNQKLLFRGLSDDDISNKGDKNTKNLDNDVDKMFKNFPPKAKS